MENGHRVGAELAYGFKNLPGRLAGKKILMQDLSGGIRDERAVGGDQIDDAGYLADQRQGGMKPAPRDDDDLDVAIDSLVKCPAVTLA